MTRPGDIGIHYTPSQVFDQEEDMRMDVTNLVLLQLSEVMGSRKRGFIIKREGNVGNSDTTTEGSGTPLGLSYFSRDSYDLST